jgi:diguanylate cyclase (GGDEF)-like protein
VKDVVQEPVGYARALATAASAMLTRVPSRWRYACTALLGYGLGALSWYLLERGALPLTDALAALPLCIALGALWVGYRASVSRRRAANTRGESGQESSIQHAFAQHALIVKNASEGIALLTDDGTVVQINPAFEHLAAIPHDALVGKSWLELAPTSERAALGEAFSVAHAKGRAIVECVLGDREASSPVELTLVRDAPVEGQTASLHLLVRDLRERRATARFEHLALHDQLTGLPNRRALVDRLEDSLKTSPRRPARVAVLLFDIDRFKHINDAFGHAAGDAVLRHAALQMSRAVRPTDTLARLGGDEFVLIARGIDSMEQAESLAQRFCHEAARPLRIQGTDISIRLSTGIALAGRSLATGDALLAAADRAMYTNKTISDETDTTGVHLRELRALFAKAREKA